MNDTNADSDNRGLLTGAAQSLFGLLKLFSVMQWLGIVNPMLRARSALKPEEIASLDFSRKRAAAVDGYVAVWLGVEVLAAAAICVTHPSFAVSVAIQVVMAIRILEIVQTNLSSTLFDLVSGSPSRSPGSTARMVVMAGVNYVELLLLFGVIYGLNVSYVEGINQPVTGFYVSAMSQLSAGAGNIFPIGWVRFVQAAQGLSGAAVIVLALVRLITAPGAKTRA
ncbi:hypothetical protein BH11PSE2_BH11PSE2_03310 [soil metagenome]